MDAAYDVAAISARSEALGQCRGERSHFRGQHELKADWGFGTREEYSSPCPIPMTCLMTSQFCKAQTANAGHGRPDTSEISVVRGAD